jgi:hypothetical protein
VPSEIDDEGVAAGNQNVSQMEIAVDTGFHRSRGRAGQIARRAAMLARWLRSFCARSRSLSRSHVCS